MFLIVGSGTHQVLVDQDTAKKWIENPKRDFDLRPLQRKSTKALRTWKGLVIAILSSSEFLDKLTIWCLKSIERSQLSRFTENKQINKMADELWSELLITCSHNFFHIWSNIVTSYLEKMFRYKRSKKYKRNFSL